jgi:Calcineurin-like phosphoesterase.
MKEGATMEMRTFLCSDIHGQYDAWMVGLEKSGFSPDSGDRLIVIGDIMDRGPRSKDCFLFLQKLRETYPDQIFYLRGNHEQMFLDFLKAEDPFSKNVSAYLWFLNGGWTTIRSFLEIRDPNRKYTLEEIARELLETVPGLLQILEGLPYYYAERDAVFVHAGFAPDTPLVEQKPEDMLWIREEFFDHFHPVKNDPLEGKWIVHGHTPVILFSDYEGEGLYIRPPRICIDGGCAAQQNLFVVEWPLLTTTIVPVGNPNSWKIHRPDFNIPGNH